MLELNLQQRFRTPSLIMRAPPLRGAHLLRPFSYAFLLLIFVTQNAHACIWQDSAHPFWPSNKIEVCFLSQEEHLTSDPLLVKAYNDTRQKIQRVLNQQFNLRNTGFELFGFKTCEYDHRKKGAKDDLPHMIRINLTSERIQDRVEMTDGLIGPINGKKSVNIHFAYLSQVTNKADKTKSWKNKTDHSDFDGLVLHETLHMLGIHHEHNWNSPQLEEDTLGKGIKLGEMDPQSIICVDPNLCDGQNGAALSKGDIRCLQEISSQRIKSAPAVANDTVVPTLQ